ncbi:MAG: enoyl-CoA hydratase/isomerase family protein [Burkholderiaceae bacterium]
MNPPEILFEIDDGIGLVTLNRPQARNALTFPMYDELARLCADISIDGPIRALIITGAGEQAFAAGTDISRFRDFKTPADAQAYEQRIDEVVDSSSAYPCRRLPRSAAPAQVAAPRWPRPATCGSPTPGSSSAFRSPAPWATACRRPACPAW